MAKCKVMHLGYNNPNLDYTMNGTNLKGVSTEKDIGVTVTKNLKPSEHCAKASITAMSVLFQLLRTFHFRDKTTFVSLYKTYVRPHLEFAAPVWNPWLAKDVELLEKVQKKFVRNISGLKGKTYAEKLSEIGLLSLEKRRVYLELVETFKIIKGLTNIDRSELFELCGDSERRHTRATNCPLNIILKRSHLDIRKHFYTNRVVNSWNNLPNEIKESVSLISFKKTLRLHLMALNSVEPGLE